MEKATGETVAIGESKFGKGIFAMKDLPAYTNLFYISGKEMNFEETIALASRESHAMQTDIRKYILVEPPFLYSNHSCDPNCGINEDFQLITIKPVAKGEELTWDYSTSMLERHWTLHCHCEAPFCRKIILDFDLIPKQIQEKYIRAEIVLPFIIKALKNAKMHFEEVFVEK